MAYDAILVKDGVAYNNWGKKFAPVVAPDGYYPNPITFSSNIQIKEGVYDLTKVNPLTIYGKGVIINDSGLFVLEDSTQETPENFGQIDGAFAGSKIVTLRYDKYTTFYYMPDEPALDMSKDLANWWLESGEKLPWIGSDNQGKGVLDPNRNSSLRAINKAAYVSTMHDCGTFMLKPGNIEIGVSKHLKRSLSKYKRFLEKQVAPIGGKITAILPAWQKGIALCWIKFTLNGVEPTKGVGCLVYKTGDFYFGPWCQAVSQGDANYGRDMIHYYPPVFTLRSWILGPLQDAMSRHTLEGGREAGPARFAIASSVLIAGRAYKREDDGTQRINSISDYTEAVKSEVALKQVNGDKYESRLIASNLKLGLKADKPTRSEPIFKVPIHVYKVRQLQNVYLVTGDYSHWYLRVIWECEYNLAVKKTREFPFAQDAIVDLSNGLWGVTELEVLGSKGLDVYCRHTQFPSENCSCAGCRKFRSNALLTFSDFGMPWPTHSPVAVRSLA